MGVLSSRGRTPLRLLLDVPLPRGPFWADPWTARRPVYYFRSRCCPATCSRLHRRLVGTVVGVLPGIGPVAPGSSYRHISCTPHRADHGGSRALHALCTRLDPSLLSTSPAKPAPSYLARRLQMTRKAAGSALRSPPSGVRRRHRLSLRIMLAAAARRRSNQFGQPSYSRYTRRDRLLSRLSGGHPMLLCCRARWRSHRRDGSISACAAVTFARPARAGHELVPVIMGVYCVRGAAPRGEGSRRRSRSVKLRELLRRARGGARLCQSRAAPPSASSPARARPRGGAVDLHLYTSRRRC